MKQAKRHMGQKVYSTEGVDSINVDTAGNVGIGTASPAFVTGGGLQISNVTQANLRLSDTSDPSYNFDVFMNNTDAYVVNRANGPMLFLTNNAERMRIDASGTLSIGGNLGYGGLNVSKTGSLSPGVFIWVNATATNQKYMSFEYNGNGGSGSITPNGTGNVAFNTGPSDHRLKEEVKPFTSGLQKVLEMKPVSFKWKESQKEDYGFIAHELQEVIPEAVTGQKDAVNEEGKPDYQAIFPAPAQMIASLVSAIQELKAELDDAKAEIAALRKQP